MEGIQECEHIMLCPQIGTNISCCVPNCEEAPFLGGNGPKFSFVFITGRQFFCKPVKGQIVNTFCFVGYMVSAATIQRHHCRAKKVIDNTCR